MYGILSGIFNPSEASPLTGVIEDIFKELLKLFDENHPTVNTVFKGMSAAIAALLFLYFLITILKHASNGQITFEQILNSFIRLAVALAILVNIKTLSYNLVKAGQIFQETVATSLKTGGDTTETSMMENYYIQVGTKNSGTQAYQVSKNARKNNGKAHTFWATNLGFQSMSNGDEKDIVSYTGPWISDVGNCYFSTCNTCKKFRKEGKKHLWQTGTETQRGKSVKDDTKANGNRIKYYLKLAKFGSDEEIEDGWSDYGDLSTNHTAAHWALQEACSEENASFFSSFTLVLVSIIMKIGTIIIGFFGIIMAYKIAIEVVIRGVFMPFAVINIIQEGSSSVSLGYLKKFFACLLSFSILLLVIWAGTKITVAASSDTFSPRASTNYHPVLGWEYLKSRLGGISAVGSAIVIKIAQVGCFALANKIPHDVIG